MQDNPTKKIKRTEWLIIFYLIAFVYTVALFLVSWFMEPKDPVPAEFGGEWYLDAGLLEKADLKHPRLTDGRCTFYTAVPEGLSAGDCLWFRDKNAEVVVTVGGERRAEITKSDHAAIYGNTVGTDWVYVPLDLTDRGKLIEISFRACYEDKSAYLADVKMGNTVNTFRAALYDRLFGTFMCVLIAVIGILLIIVYVVLRPHISGMPKGLLYIGACSVATAVWLFSELRVVQIFTDKPAGILHNVTCMSLMLIALPLVYYFREDLDRIHKYIVPIVALVSISNFVLCTALHVTGIADYHETLSFTHFTLGLMAVCVILANFVRCFKSRERSFAEVLPAVTMILVGVATVADMVRYNSGAVNDSAFLTRIAVFVYMVTLGVSNLAYVVKMVKKGLRTDIVSRLAYEDGLTGLGNRTAYIEAVEQIGQMEQGEKITVFVFDINNLKYVNDNLGHIAGDKLITAAADTISMVFGKVGKCYRTGGDEFVCLAGGNVQGDAYREAFYGEISDFNKKGKLEFPLMVAMGYEVYNGKGSFQEAIDSADKKMYAKKAELKTQSFLVDRAGNT